MKPSSAQLVALAIVAALAIGCRAHEPQRVPGDPTSRRVTLRMTSQPEAQVAGLTLRLADLVHAAIQEDTGVRYASTVTLVAREGGREQRVQFDAQAVVFGYRLKMFMAGALAGRADGPIEETVVLDVTPPDAQASP